MQQAQRRSLIDAAMASSSLIQLKLQAGRKRPQAETTKLIVLNYIDAVTATDTAPHLMSSACELPEGMEAIIQYLEHWRISTSSVLQIDNVGRQAGRLLAAREESRQRVLCR